MDEQPLFLYHLHEGGELVKSISAPPARYVEVWEAAHVGAPLQKKVYLAMTFHEPGVVYCDLVTH